MSEQTPTHNVVSAADTLDTVHSNLDGGVAPDPTEAPPPPEWAEPHPLEGVETPTTGSLTVEDGATLERGETVGLVAEFEPHMGLVGLRYKAVQDDRGESYVVRDGGWHWSGHETPRTIRVETGGRGWDSGIPAEVHASLVTLKEEPRGVYSETGELAALTFTVNPATKTDQPAD